MDKKQKNKIERVLASKKLMVLSTVLGSNKPQSALVAFAEDGLTLYFQTRKTTRKALNLGTNPNVSAVIGWELSELLTLQLDGVAELVTDAKATQSIKERFIAKDSPTKREHLDHPDVVFYMITPTWARYSDYKNHDIWEAAL